MIGKFVSVISILEITFANIGTIANQMYIDFAIDDSCKSFNSIQFSESRFMFFHLTPPSGAFHAMAVCVKKWEARPFTQTDSA